MSKITEIWEKIAKFMHEADLLPLVIAASFVAFTKTLMIRYSIWVAAPLGLGIDLLLLRLVGVGVRSKRLGWWLLAAPVFSMAYLLQLIFYLDANGPAWQAFTFAAVVPVLIVLLAVLYERKQAGLDKEKSLAINEQLNQAKSDLEQTKTQLTAAQDNATEFNHKWEHAKTQLTAAQGSKREVETDLKIANKQLKQVESQLTAAQKKLETTKSQLTAAKAELNELKIYKTAINRLNPLYRAVVGREVGLVSDTQESIAATYGVSSSRISQIKGQIIYRNGG